MKEAEIKLSEKTEKAKFLVEKKNGRIHATALSKHGNRVVAPIISSSV